MTLSLWKELESQGRDQWRHLVTNKNCSFFQIFVYRESKFEFWISLFETPAPAALLNTCIVC